MKTIKLIIPVLVIFILQARIHAQFDGYSTHYFNYFSNLAYSNDVAEDVVMDDAANTYVAGERAKETSLHSLEIIKYANNGSSILKSYVNNTYREYVKKILSVNNNLFVICNAVNTSNDANTLLVLKYNSSLTLLSSSFYLNYNFYAPEAATNDAAGNLYILCSSKHSANTNMSIVKLNSSINFVGSVSYSQENLDDDYTESPKSIFFNSSENCIYACGSSLNTITGKSAAFLLKYNASTLQMAWKKRSVLATGKNIYNAVMAGTSRVYVTGSLTSAGKNELVLSNYTLDGNDGKTARYSGATLNYNQNEGLKITAVSFSGALLVGSSKDETGNKYDILVSAYTSSSNVFNYIKHDVLPYNSAINAAITSWGGTYVTGRKAVGSDQNMFLYQYDTENGSGNVVYRDAIENRSAAGNAIAAGSTGFNPDGYFLLRVAGYRDTRSGLAVPHDYGMFSRHYFRFIIGFAKKTVTDDEAMAGKLNAGNTRSVMFQNVPNPFIQSTVINYDLLPGIAKANIVVYNAAGNIVRTFALNGKGTGSVTLNANGLTPGNYYYELIIDGKKTDSKQMVLIK